LDAAITYLKQNHLESGDTGVFLENTPDRHWILVSESSGKPRGTAKDRARLTGCRYLSHRRQANEAA
jgi:hypothetical protein